MIPLLKHLLKRDITCLLQYSWRPIFWKNLAYSRLIYLALFAITQRYILSQETLSTICFLLKESREFQRPLPSGIHWVVHLIRFEWLSSWNSRWREWTLEILSRKESGRDDLNTDLMYCRAEERICERV